MDANQPGPLSGDVNTLNEYHKRLSNLLDRMERLEESLKAIPLVRPRYTNAIKDEEESEVKSIEYHKLEEVDEDVESLEKLKIYEEDIEDMAKEKLEEEVDESAD